MSVRVTLSPTLSGDAEVDGYLEAHPGACFGHQPGWRRAVWRTYRLPCIAAVARRGREVVGVAPWTLMLGPLTGPYLVIAPFASYGDVLADDGEIRSLLLERTRRWARWLGVAHAQERGLRRPPVADACRTDSGRFITSVIDLEGGARRVWTGRLHAKTRNQIRKARRNGVEVRPVTGDWRPFVEVTASGTRSLGSPFHGARFFEELRSAWGERLAAWVAFTQDGQPAAAALRIQFQDTAHYVYGQNVHALRSSCANSLVLWRLIEDACGRGLAAADLGRSERGTPAERFKRKWGGEDRPLHDTLLSVCRRSVPDLNPTNPSFTRVRRVWSRLPLALTRRLGPLLMRGIG